MAKGKLQSGNGFESVKIRTGIVNKVRKNKKETGVPVATFFELAAQEKLTNQSK